jgi:GTP cyclohydrolase I
MNQLEIRKHIEAILTLIGEDVTREGIKYTPHRVARQYSDMFYGYRKQLQTMNEEERNTTHSDDIIPITVFENNQKEMLIRRVKFISHCEHHATPFFGEAWVGIIPDKLLLGMNKIDKIVKYFAARLQIQERLTTQIVDWINDNINPAGVICVIRATHLCALLQNDEGDFTTSAVRGIFLKPEPNKNPKIEFLELIKLEEK